MVSILHVFSTSHEFPRFNYYFANKAGIGRIHANISLSIQNKIQLAGCVTKFIDKFQLTRRWLSFAIFHRI